MWYIGQEVVALEGGDGDVIQAGKVYSIRAVTACKCSAVLDVGFDSGRPYWCSGCREDHPRTGAWWMNAKFFAPLDTLMKEEIEELVKYDEIYGVKLSEL